MQLNDSRNVTKHRKRSAFTLVELLVVIGIIALLISILLPAITKARESANRIVCLGSLRALGQLAIVYTNDNKGQLPCVAESIALQRLDPQYITTEMNDLFGLPHVLTATGLPIPGAISKLWKCPDNSEISKITQWVDVSVPVITQSTYLLETSYMYCGDGYGPLSGFNTSPNAASVNPGSSYTRYRLAVKISDRPAVPLFADKIQWHFQLGLSVNHGIKLRPSGGFGNPVTPGQNKVFTDGHGEWVDLSKVTLLNAGQLEGPPQSASVPVVIYPQPGTLPKGYPAVFHMGTYPFYAMWYW